MVRLFDTEKPEVEILDGAGHPKEVSPKVRHGLVQGALQVILAGCARGRGFCGPEMRFRIEGARKRTRLVPDVAFISRERLASMPPELRDEPTSAPELAIEILSPRDDHAFLAEKIAAYLANGSLVALVVDTVRFTIAEHTSHGVRTLDRDARYRSAQLRWLEFNVQDVFSEVEAFDAL